jgi:hypothetical protein
MLTTLISNPLLIGLIVLAIITIILLFMVISMHFKMKKFLIDVDAKNIAESLTSVANNMKELQKFRNEMEEYLTSVEKRLRKSIQSVSTVRFNPFHGAGGGGNQSFATTFLNEEGDGVVISSLYSREQTSVYSKPIKGYASEHELSTEEKEAVEKAKMGLK